MERPENPTAVTPREIPINLSDLIAAAAWLLFVGCTIGIFMGMCAS